MAYTGTKLSNLVDPQVLGEYLDVKLMDAIKFAPLCSINNELQGKAGDTLTLPVYQFIGLATDVAEGEDIPMSTLSATTTTQKVKKCGRGVTVSDEAILSAYGSPVNEIGKQLLMSIAGKVDNDCVVEFRKATLAVTATKFDKYVIADMLAKFGEDLEENMVALINPAHLAALLKDPDFVQINQGDVIINGTVGYLFGCKVVISNKVATTEVFLVKEGAVEILLKRNVAVEADRDIVNKTNVFVADEHYVAYLKDASKIVKATISA